MNWNKRDFIFILIIICLAVGWVGAVINQQASVTHITKLYNHLVNECNEVIGAKNITDFCITLPNGTQQCNQNDLNALQPFG